MLDLPKFHEFMTPLLLVLQANGEMYRLDATDAVIKSTGSTPEQVAITHETSGNSIVKNRIGWAAALPGPGTARGSLFKTAP